MSNRTANRTRKTAAKTTAKKSAPKATATKARPVEQLATPDKTQKSVRVRMDLDQLPKGNGGVRFKERGDAHALRTAYLGQPEWALLGKPKALVIDITVE